MIACVVFDFGQVLASPETLYADLAASVGADPAALEAAYWVGRRAYDEGGTDASYWGAVLRTLGKPDAPETIRALAQLDTQLWTAMRPEAHRLLLDVRAAGCRTAVLSNAPFALDLAFADQPYADDADYWFVSASMGVTKPDPAVYARVQEVVDLPPDQIAFVDDRPANVHGARQAGWEAHLFVNDADTREWLESLGVL